MCFHETGCSVWIEIAHEGWLIPTPSLSWQLSEYILIKFNSAANSNAECSWGSAFQQCPPALPSFHGMVRVPADVRTVLSCSLSNTDLAVLLGQCFLLCISGVFLSSSLWNIFGIHSLFGTEKDYSVSVLSFPSSLAAIFKSCQGFLFQRTVY